MLSGMNRRTFIGVLAAPLISQGKPVEGLYVRTPDSTMTGDLGGGQMLSVESLREAIARFEEMVEGAPILLSGSVYFMVGEEQ